MTKAKGYLCDLYKQLTHGGNYWRDQYLLECWDQCVQPVVYRNSCYHGYKLLRRLGDWCWLTQDPKTKLAALDLAQSLTLGSANVVASC